VPQTKAWLRDTYCKALAISGWQVLRKASLVSSGQGVRRRIGGGRARNSAERSPPRWGGRASFRKPASRKDQKKHFSAEDLSLAKTRRIGKKIYLEKGKGDCYNVEKLWTDYAF
jgi:hypothetical protein